MEPKTYKASELARLSGLSVRTLHHYDQIGLLVPHRDDNGYRRYGTGDVSRLQQIMLWRACGMELRHIKELLDNGGYDERSVLEDQLRALQEQREQIDGAIRNVRETLESLDKGVKMNDQERFEGLKQKVIEDNERTFGKEARALHGSQAVDDANKALAAMDEEAWNDMNALEEQIKQLLTKAMASGNTCGLEAQELVRAHARWLSLHWGKGAYNAEAHRGLADGYLADDRFVSYYDGACGAGATKFLHDAIHQLA